RVEDAYRTLIYDENRRDYDRTLRDIPITPEPPQPELRYQPRPPAPPTVVPRVEERPPAPQTPRAATPQPAPAPPAVPEVPQPAPPDITEFTGAVLKMLRELRGLSTRNVADATKLSMRYIESIEDDSYKKLPARPYLRGFLFSYARALGYEPHRIVNDYLKRYDAVMNPPKK
ncbi:MAG: helix-turn-helix domain-containing protein, partial [Nitrospirae bacterium]|nr:helix-turn-helix domain-containing protein [Nitrospirota bacterium]